MKLLLDTHALIWALELPEKLGRDAEREITDPDNQLLLSAGSMWEIGIKVGLQKLELSAPYRDWMSRAIANLDLSILPITLEDSDVQGQLPRHHKDPFDRLLAAQSIVLQIPIVSQDEAFDAYGIRRIW